MIDVAILRDTNIKNKEQEMLETLKVLGEFQSFMEELKLYHRWLFIGKDSQLAQLIADTLLYVVFEMSCFCHLCLVYETMLHAERHRQ